MQNRLTIAALLLLISLTACAGGALQPLPTEPLTAPPLSSEAEAKAPQPDGPILDEFALSIQPLEATIFGLYARVELDLQTATMVGNPFDPAQIDMQVTFIAPSGTEFNIPAFWYQDFHRDTLNPIGDPGWKARFTPNEVGTWRAWANLAGEEVAESGHSTEISFDVTESDTKGFVRIDARNPRYFAFDDGTPYFAIGLNLGWVSGAPPTGYLRPYERWLTQLSDNGGNVARVWMASWAFGLEWQDTGLGDYSIRMRRAWLLDQLFEMAAERDVTIILTLINHGAFSTSSNTEWDKNPYNAAIGGPNGNPGDFATNPESKELYKRRLRYMAARWSYATSLLAWEWWNEVNLTAILDNKLEPWLIEMTPVLRQYDPHHHLITNSYTDGTRTDLWRMDELDVAQHHDYTGRDPVESFPVTYGIMSRNAGEKPIIIGELGFAAGGESNTADLETVHFHNGLWAAPFTGFASTGMHWWWDTFVDQQNRWGEFRGISDFLAGEDLAMMAVSRGSLSSEEADALILQSEDRVLVWIRAKSYDVGAAEEAYNTAILDAIKSKTKLTEWRYEPPVVTNLTLTVSDRPDDGATYLARWYDPQGATWRLEESVTVEGSSITISVPDLTADIALKLERQ